MSIYAVCHAMVDLWHAGHIFAGILAVIAMAFLCDRALFGSSSAAVYLSDPVDRYHGHHMTADWDNENYWYDEGKYDGYYG